ncbi:VOC family protein [Leptospira sp. 96542]|nr:VOC family protein [Leptospira sp. 96542]
MKFLSIQKGIITEKLTESKEYYQKWFGMQIKFEADWFVLLHLPEKPEFEIGFMLPGVEAVKKTYFQKPYSGSGVWLIFEAEDVKQTYKELQNLNAPIDLPLTEEEWGDVHFTMVDPNGIGIDIVQMRNS